MIKSVSISVFILILGWANFGFAQNHKYSGWQKGPWEKHKSKNRMVMYLNDEVASGIDGIRIDTVIDLPVEHVFPIIVDPKRAASYSFIREFKILKKNADGTGYLYQRLRATGVSDRDFTVFMRQVIPKIIGKGSYGWLWKQANEKGPKPKKGVVRANIVAGSYILTPVGSKGKKTRVSYRLWFDPNSWIPDFIINIKTRAGAFETVRRLRVDAAIKRKKMDVAEEAKTKNGKTSKEKSE